MTIRERQKDLVDEFSIFSDWQEKYAHIIELGRELPPMNPEWKNEAHKVKGCQSRVWLHAELSEAGTMRLAAESDALIVQGLIAILLRIFEDQTPEAILGSHLFCFEQMGLLSHLSMNRTNGLNSMLQSIHIHAAAFAGSADVPSAPSSPASPSPA
jgi:cysteine desulfuration protein SufE